jgi:hypothetical protein
MTAKKETTERVKVKGWPGYVRGGVFVIEKRIKTKKWHVSTRCTSLRSALKQLERFEVDPSRYRADGTAGAELVLTLPLIDEFFAWHSARNTRQWALNVKSLLIDWANHLRGADLRSLSLVDDLKAHLRGATQQPHRVKAIRSFFKWLRTEKGLVTRQQDATLDLQVPPAKPAQWAKSKAVAWEHVVAVLPHLRVDVRDALEFLAATGWHLEELRRFAREGSIRERELGDAPATLAVIGVKHKSGRPHFTSLAHQQHVDVAKRIRARGHLIDRGALRKRLRAAVSAANVEARKKDERAPLIPFFTLGVMRHSVTNWLQEAGVSVEERGQYLGHNPTTNARFYVDAQRPPVVLPQRVLRVVT